MMNTETKEEKPRHLVLREIFLDYVENKGNYWDEAAAKLVDILIRETAWAAPSAEHAFDNQRRGAEEALDLLGHVPHYPKPEGVRPPEANFPKTRRALWSHIVVGLVYGADDKFEAYARALMEPGLLSREEERELKQCLDETLGSYFQNDHAARTRVCAVIKDYAMRGSDASFSALLKLVSQWGKIEEKRSIVGA